MLDGILTNIACLEAQKDNSPVTGLVLYDYCLLGCEVV